MKRWTKWRIYMLFFDDNLRCCETRVKSSFEIKGQKIWTYHPAHDGHILLVSLFLNGLYFIVSELWTIIWVVIMVMHVTKALRDCANSFFSFDCLNNMLVLFCWRINLSCLDRQIDNSISLPRTSSFWNSVFSQKLILVISTGTIFIG